MFWIALKLYYTARTGSGPAPASRRRAAAAKSAPAAPLRPVRVVGYAESRGALHTAPGCSGPLPALIPVAYSRYGHVIAASRCPPGSARGPVNEARAPLGTSTIDPRDVSRRRAQLQHAWRSRPCYGDSRTLQSGRLAGSARCWAQRRPAWSAGPESPLLARADSSVLPSVSLRRSTAGGALRVRHGVTSGLLILCPAAADVVLGCHRSGSRCAAADKLAELRAAAYLCRA